MESGAYIFLLLVCFSYFKIKLVFPDFPLYSFRTILHPDLAKDGKGGLTGFSDGRG